ncbi:hypothetical protein CsSME_00008973 [Camellia sinensis var. sinensis]
MARDGQKEKTGDDTPAGSGRPIDLDVEGDNCNTETHDQNRSRKDVGQDDSVQKKPEQSKYYNEDDL